jgi:hypothetical protein
VQPFGSSQHFMEPEGSLPRSQEPSTCKNYVKNKDVRFEVLTAVTMKNFVFWEYYAVWLF